MIEKNIKVLVKSTRIWKKKKWNQFENVFDAEMKQKATQRFQRAKFTSKSSLVPQYGLIYDELNMRVARQ